MILLGVAVVRLEIDSRDGKGEELDGCFKGGVG